MVERSEDVAEVQNLLGKFKCNNNVEANCVGFDIEPAEVVMNKLMEVSDTEAFEDNQLEIDLEVERQVESSSENTSTEDNPTYQFYFDDNDLPSFSGDYMDHMEWKKKWQNLVSPYIENPRLELGLL